MFHNCRPVQIRIGWFIPCVEGVEKMFAEVPYLQDRMSRKLSVTGTMGPDEIEQNIHTTAACSDLVQPRSCRLLDIPVCFPEACHLLRTPCVRVQFLLQLQLLRNCQMTWILLCDSQRVSVRVFLCTQFKTWRRSRLRQLTRLARGVEDTYLARTLEQHKSVSFHKGAPFLEPARLALVLASLHWPDHDAPLLCATVFTIAWSACSLRCFP